MSRDWNSSSKEDNAFNTSDRHVVERHHVEDPVKDVCEYDWSKKITSGCCGCFSFLQQLIFVVMTGSFLFGLNLSLMNTAISYIAWELEWCDFRFGKESVDGCTHATIFKSFISTSVFVGAAIGSMTGGSFLAYGRRGMILISMAIFILGSIASVVSNSFSALLWARLVCGYAVGLVSVCVPVYMSEVTPAEVRGFYGVFHQLGITIGILIGTAVGLPMALTTDIPDVDKLVSEGHIVMPQINLFSKIWWRVMQGIQILPILFTVYLMGCVYTFETPHYYVERQRYADAEELLKRITNKAEVTAELTQITEDLATAKKAKEAGMSLGAAMKRSDFRWVIFYGCVLSAMQQFSGINVFIASSNQLFSKAGLTGKMPTVMSNVMNLINCVMTLPAVPLIEKLGRRTLLVFGTALMTCAVAPAAVCYWALGSDSDVTMWLAIVGCLTFIVAFATTYGPILWVYLFEIYPTEIKGAAGGLATAFNWLAGILMVFVVAYLDNKYAYTLFLVMCGLAFVIIILGMKETRGLPLGESPYIKK